MIVLADRYRLHRLLAATWRAASIPRGCARLQLSAPRPDLALYFRVPIEVSSTACSAGGPKLKYHEAGMDLNGLAPDPAQSFRILPEPASSDIYDRLAEEFELAAWSTATGTIAVPAEKLCRAWCRTVLRGYARPPAVGRTKWRAPA